MKTSADYLERLVLDPAPRQRLLALALLAAASVYLVHHSLDPTAASPFAPPWDKLAHFTFFAGLACLGWVMLGARHAWGALMVIAIVAGVGAADEIAQGTNPLRVMDVHDWLADVGGAIVATTTLLVCGLRLRRRRATRASVWRGLP